MQTDCKCEQFIFVGDDDSGTDENCDSPPLSPLSPPTSGFAMAKKMAVGVVSEESEESTQNYTDSDKLLQSCVGLMLSSNLPTADTLAKLRQRKKVSAPYYTFVSFIKYLPLSSLHANDPNLEI